MRRTVLLTGATGFVGGAIARELAAHDYRLHALARAASDRSRIAELDPIWHEGDLEDGAAVGRAIEAAGPGAWVVHNAGLVSYRTRDAARAHAVNVEGTRHVLDASAAVGVERLLFVSSIVTVGHAAGDVVLDEGAPFNGAGLGVHYVTTKRLAEELVLAAAPSLDVRVVNPGVVFGVSEAPSNSSRLVGRLAAGRVGPLAPPGGASVVGLGDVGRGVRLALERGRRGRRYLLCESYCSHLALMHLLARELGVAAPRRRASERMWRMLIAGARAIDRLRPLELATPQALTMLGLNFRAEGARARSELGWEPRPFADVAREVARAVRVGG